MITLTVMSAFAMDAPIPTKYAGTGANLSPLLSWSQVPTNTQSIAILCDDPDAPMGDWVHWVLFNLPPHATKLDEGVPTQAQLLTVRFRAATVPMKSAMKVPTRHRANRIATFSRSMRWTPNSL